MKNSKIAYLSWGNSPCNYRRFSKFSELVGLQSEPYNTVSEYDIIIVTQASDLTYWSRFPRNKTKLVFDFVDSYLKIEPWELKGNLRGLSKFIVGQHRYFDLSYSKLLKRMIERADAVVCSTPEQKLECLEFNLNTHDILDFNDDQVKVIKQNYKIGAHINFVWEGMGGNAWAFQEIAPVLKRIHQKNPIALHFVTDIEYKSYNVPFAWPRKVKPYLNKILGDIPVYLYEWNSFMLSTICTKCDIALLPIPKKPAIYWAKPENRLLMLWRMGLPVLTSANPAFLRCMQDSGSDLACETQEEWEEKLSLTINDEKYRCESAHRGLIYGQKQVNKDVLSRKWFQVLESIA